ncbi:MAG: UxaA family hydrolase, partial [Eubacterium sp.]|nr:UxaA family hydrolase [Eubacterium sp.]
MREFMGYMRPDGSVGTRNYVAVLPSVNCMNDISYQIAAAVPG